MNPLITDVIEFVWVEAPIAGVFMHAVFISVMLMDAGRLRTSRKDQINISTGSA